MKILIADDERLARYSLRSMLEEIGVPARSIDTAKDGEEMLESVRRGSHDLVFVDIKMPRLDGLTAIERAQGLSKRTRWVIVTSHASFDFARSAIRLRAVEYLLKPVSPGELAQVVERVRTELRAELARLNDELEGRLGSLLHGTLSLEDESAEPLAAACFLPALLIFDSALDEKRLAERQLAACAEIRARVNSSIDASTRMALCTLPEGQLALVGVWQPSAADAAARESLRGLFRRTQVTLETLGREVCLTPIVCDECPGFAALLERLSRACALADLRITAGIGRRIELSELEEQSRDERRRQVAAGAAGLAAAFRSRSRLEFLSSLEATERALGDPALDATAAPNVARFFAAAVGVDGLPGSPQWRERMRALGERLTGGEAGAQLVERVAAFVRGGNLRDTGIAQIAFHLGVTPNYLSTLFHRQRGVTLLKYLTRQRMEKARELLAAGSRVHEAAAAVGYASARHFSRLFQRHFGAYPSELPRMEKRAPGS